MTTPVQMDSRTGAMSFIMPSKYWGPDRLPDAPAPAEGAGVRLVAKTSGETVAVTTFGGYARGAAVAARTRELLDALEGPSAEQAALDEGLRIEVPDREATTLLQYNDPFTVPWKRR